MTFLMVSAEDAINLNNLAHVWIEKCDKGYFLMGEMIHNSEEVVLTETFEFKSIPMQILKNIVHNQPERLSERTPKGEAIV